MHNKSFIICLLLCVTILLVFYQVQNHDFINFDDPLYVYENVHVKSGLNRAGLIWAFSTTHSANWHPLTWLSHMLDCQLYGLNPGGHHVTNVLFHMANSVLLFLVLYRMTSGLWMSAWVAALFALHPLHVESVAWVAERKDVLSTFFWILTMWMYVRYTEQPDRTRYVLTLLIFVFGLLSKPMLVTLPFVLLLLDYWPLQRLSTHQPEDDITAPMRAVGIHRSSLLSLLWEKIPFFVLAAVSSLITFFVQKSGGAMPSLEIHPVEVRIANALLSYVSYIGQMIWPQDLAVFYPHPGSALPLWQIFGAGLLLLCISIAVIRAARHHPYLPVGWLWYLGTLVPVIGLVQVGMQARADRYTYIPLIGLFIMVAWGFPKLLANWRHRRAIITAAACIVLAAMMIMTWSQVRHWKNSITLFRHALQLTSDNHLAHNNLGDALAQKGKFEEAIEHFTKALEIWANFPEANKNYAAAHFNLALALVRQERLEEAIAHFSEALRTQPDDADTHYNLGVTLEKQGRLEEAMIQFSEVLRIQPDNAEARNNMGVILTSQGRFKEAISHYSKALQHNPNDGETHNNLGVALFTVGQLDQAIGHYLTAIKLDPNLALALVRQERLEEPLPIFPRPCGPNLTMQIHTTILESLSKNRGGWRKP